MLTAVRLGNIDYYTFDDTRKIYISLLVLVQLGIISWFEIIGPNAHSQTILRIDYGVPVSWSIAQHGSPGTIR